MANKHVTWADIRAELKQQNGNVNKNYCLKCPLKLIVLISLSIDVVEIDNKREMMYNRSLLISKMFPNKTSKVVIPTRFL